MFESLNINWPLCRFGRDSGFLVFRCGCYLYLDRSEAGDWSINYVFMPGICGKDAHSAAYREGKHAHVSKL